MNHCKLWSFNKLLNEYVGHKYHKTWKQPNRALSYHNFLVAAFRYNPNKVFRLHVEDFFLFFESKNTIVKFFNEFEQCIMTAFWDFAPKK